MIVSIKWWLKGIAMHAKVNLVKPTVSKTISIKSKNKKIKFYSKLHIFGIYIYDTFKLTQTFL